MPSQTINKSLMTTLLFDGFWERWLAHGVILEDLNSIRSTFTNLENWVKGWSALGDRKMVEGLQFKQNQKLSKAEAAFRTASLYYNLTHWIFPENDENKQKWYKISQRAFLQADDVSDIPVRYETLEINSFYYEGRVRIPQNPKGVLIIINPLDSCKEEMYIYESDFIKYGFITINFDGPGQGATYTLNGLIGNKERWSNFLNSVIEYASNAFPDLPLHLFGTSSGATWAIVGSCHEKVAKTIAVSPATPFQTRDKELPHYFLERMKHLLVEPVDFLPDVENCDLRGPILLFHGQLDAMINSSDMYRWYENFPFRSELIEFPDEGHCCNNQLNKIRRMASEWLVGEAEK